MSVTCALEFIDNDATQHTRLIIRMINKSFDCLNAKGPLMGGKTILLLTIQSQTIVSR